MFLEQNTVRRDKIRSQPQWTASVFSFIQSNINYSNVFFVGLKYDFSYVQISILQIQS